MYATDKCKNNDDECDKRFKRSDWNTPSSLTGSLATQLEEQYIWVKR